MKERKHLEYCLIKIEEIYNKSDHALWTDGDYKKIAQSILEKSGIPVSTHTLKRLFGKIEYKKVYTPQSGTRNALAKYIGFESWDEFVESDLPVTRDANTKEARETEGSPIHKNRIKKPLHKIIYITLGLLAISLFVFFINKKPSFNRSDVDFRVENYKGMVPHTVTFHFNPQEIKSDNVILDYDFIHPYLGSEYLLTNHNDSVIKYTYQIPGIYYPRLFADNNIVDSVLVIAETDGWISFYRPEPDDDLFWLDNLFKIEPRDGYLSFNRSDIFRLIRDTSRVYYTTHRNIQNFGLEGNNYILETGLLNSQGTGGITCYDVNLFIYYENEVSFLRLVERNCQAYAEIKLGDNFLDGTYEELTFLTRDLNNWTDIRIEMIDGNAVLFLDGNEIHTDKFSNPPGEIIGLEFRFKGSGRIDYINISNPEGAAGYSEDF